MLVQDTSVMSFARTSLRVGFCLILECKVINKMIELILLIALILTWFVVIPIWLAYKNRSDIKHYYKGFNEGYNKAHEPKLVDFTDKSEAPNDDDLYPYLIRYKDKFSNKRTYVRLMNVYNTNKYDHHTKRILTIGDIQDRLNTIHNIGNGIQQDFLNTHQREGKK